MPALASAAIDSEGVRPAQPRPHSALRAQSGIREARGGAGRRALVVRGSPYIVGRYHGPGAGAE